MEVMYQELLKQGPLITALIIAIIYFYRKQNKLEEDYTEQSEKVEKFLSDDRTKMIQIIENNTNVMKENASILKENIELLRTIKK